MGWHHQAILNAALAIRGLQHEFMNIVFGFYTVRVKGSCTTHRCNLEYAWITLVNCACLLTNAETSTANCIVNGRFDVLRM